MLATDEVFLNRAVECKRMAESARDRGSKATWSQMAERWHRYAEMATSASLAATHQGSNRHRKKAAHGWAAQP